MGVELPLGATLFTVFDQFFNIMDILRNAGHRQLRNLNLLQDVARSAILQDTCSLVPKDILLLSKSWAALQTMTCAFVFSYGSAHAPPLNARCTQLNPLMTP
jgi:hypothetical protein